MQKSQRAFTLIELSIVLVIIGLLVGGVLVGRDLIRAAEVRAQISQIEKFQTAVNVFKGKFNALPGDMEGATASQFGFAARGASQGQGDGNTILEGSVGFGYKGVILCGGETAMFWSDLSYANGLNVNLIEGAFKNASETSCLTYNSDLLMPAAKIPNNYVYVYTRGFCCPWVNTDPTNYFGLSRVIAHNNPGDATTAVGITVKQAYSIDKKIDDGYPTQGNVDVTYAGLNFSPPSTNAVSPSSATCYDTTSNQYSLTQNNGDGVNCALSFKVK